MSSFLLEIITPERIAFSQPAEMVSVPSSTGILGILAGHTPLFVNLIEGELKFIQNKQEHFLSIGGGFMEVVKGKVTILVTRAVHAEEIR